MKNGDATWKNRKLETAFGVPLRRESTVGNRPMTKNRLGLMWVRTGRRFVVQSSCGSGSVRLSTPPWLWTLKM